MIWYEYDFMAIMTYSILNKNVFTSYHVFVFWGNLIGTYGLKYKKCLK